MKPLPELTDDELSERLRAALALPDAPPALIQRAVGAWALQAPAPSAAVQAALAAGALARGVGRRLVAVLSFDSWAASPLAAGVRGLRTDMRQFLFSADGRDVDLRVSAEGARFAIAGQILGPDEAGRVELSTAEGAAAPASRSAELDDMGEFRIADVEPGRYVVTLHVGADEIVLPEIEVGGR